MVILGDGAQWIGEQNAEYSHVLGKTITEILKFFHAMGTCVAVAQAVWPEDPSAAKTSADPRVMESSVPDGRGSKRPGRCRPPYPPPPPGGSRRNRDTSPITARV